MNFDPRDTLSRNGVAAELLEGLIAASRFAPTRTCQVVVPAAALRVAPDPRAEQASQLLFGEDFERLESADAFVFGQASRDGYVGYVEASALSEEVIAPTHWVRALRTFAFDEPSIKSPPRGLLSLNALVTIVDEAGALARAERIGWIAAAHLAPVGDLAEDPAEVALAHLGAPYLWGGRESTGLDCSGLIQQALFACGKACPRDSDQQQALGREAPADRLRRGDLVFWRGHVGMMLDADRLVHANGHHMAVAVEPLAVTRARIAAAGGGEPIAFRRL